VAFVVDDRPGRRLFGPGELEPDDGGLDLILAQRR
jgi:hypothetical protein